MNPYTSSTTGQESTGSVSDLFCILGSEINLHYNSMRMQYIPRPFIVVTG